MRCFALSSFTALSSFAFHAAQLSAATTTTAAAPLPSTATTDLLSLSVVAAATTKKIKATAGEQRNPRSLRAAVTSSKRSTATAVTTTTITSTITPTSDSDSNFASSSPSGNFSSASVKPPLDHTHPHNHHHFWPRLPLLDSHHTHTSSSPHARRSGPWVAAQLRRTRSWSGRLFKQATDSQKAIHPQSHRWTAKVMIQQQVLQQQQRDEWQHLLATVCKQSEEKRLREAEDAKVRAVQEAKAERARIAAELAAQESMRPFARRITRQVSIRCSQLPPVLKRVFTSLGATAGGRRPLKQKWPLPVMEANEEFPHAQLDVAKKLQERLRSSSGSSSSSSQGGSRLLLNRKFSADVVLYDHTRSNSTNLISDTDGSLYRPLAVLDREELNLHAITDLQGNWWCVNERTKWKQEPPSRSSLSSIVAYQRVPTPDEGRVTRLALPLRTYGGQTPHSLEDVYNGVLVPAVAVSGGCSFYDAANWLIAAGTFVVCECYNRQKQQLHFLAHCGRGTGKATGGGKSSAVVLLPFAWRGPERAWDEGLWDDGEWHRLTRSADVAQNAVHRRVLALWKLDWFGACWAAGSSTLAVPPGLLHFAVTSKFPDGNIDEEIEERQLRMRISR